MTLHRFVSRVLDYTGKSIPAQWRLPIRYYGWAYSSDAEPELVHMFAVCRNFRCAVDVGTNHGFYAYRMAQRFAQVFAFEANTQVDYDIRHYKKPNIRFFPYGLSDSNRIADLNIPVHKGIPYTGWASLETRDLPFADSFDQVRVELQQLDDQPFVRETTVDLIKIDVEGHELEVLKGGLQTIRRDRPVLIIEDNAEQRTAVRALLESIGYQGTTLTKLTALPGDSPNLIYLPF